MEKTKMEQCELVALARGFFFSRFFGKSFFFRFHGLFVKQFFPDGKKRHPNQSHQFESSNTCLSSCIFQLQLKCLSFKG